MNTLFDLEYGDEKARPSAKKIRLDSEMERWPHQKRGLQIPREAYAKGHRRPLVVAPTGAGKSTIQRDIARGALDNGKKCLLMVHRRVLLEQVIEQFTEQGIDYGVIAAGQESNPHAPMQICMLQTLGSRKKKVSFRVPEADVVIWDEQHVQKTGQALELNTHFRDRGAFQVGFTATPIDCGMSNDTLCVAANYTDMLECGAHLPIKCFGPDRPDLSLIKPMSAGEYSENQTAKIMKVPTVFGRVFDHWEKLNPEHLPAINFGPGVPECRAFVHEFASKGVPTASIDSKGIMIARYLKVDGVKKIVIKEYDNDAEARRGLFTDLQFGGVKILHNRFILREAFDAPYIYQCILTTPMRLLATYLQSVGRVMRSHPDYEFKILQDHGGALETVGLGIPNLDRDWYLQCTEAKLRNAAKAKLQKKKGEDAEPICCPRCCAFRTHGSSCPECGHRHKQSCRMVRQINGELKQKRGRIVKHKKPKTCEQIWSGTLFGVGRQGKRVSQAVWLAKKRCEEAGVKWEPNTFRGNLRVPSDTSQAVRRVYPWTGR